MMQMQYRSGNLKGYLEYKNFWDYLEKDCTDETGKTSQQYEKMAAESVHAREKAEDGRELSLDTSALSYDVLSYMFQNPGGTKDYFNERYWSDYMKDIVSKYLTADR